jgi:hypothetical protein
MARVITVQEAAEPGNPAGGAADVARVNQATYDLISADYERRWGTGGGNEWFEPAVDWLASALEPGAGRRRGLRPRPGDPVDARAGAAGVRIRPVRRDAQVRRAAGDVPG